MGFLYDPCNYKEISLVSEVSHLCTTTEEEEEKKLHHSKSYISRNSEKT